MRKSTQCPSFHYIKWYTISAPKKKGIIEYRISTQLNRIKKWLPRLPRKAKRRVAGGYGTKSSSPSNPSNQQSITLLLRKRLLWIEKRRAASSSGV